MWPSSCPMALATVAFFTVASLRKIKDWMLLLFAHPARDDSCMAQHLFDKPLNGFIAHQDIEQDVGRLGSLAWQAFKVDEREAHGLGLLLGGGRTDSQLRPDTGPSLLAKHLSGDETIRLLLHAARFCWIHIAAACEALVQVLLMYADLYGHVAALFGGKLCAHARTIA